MARSFRFRLFTTIWPWPSFNRLLSAKHELCRIDRKLPQSRTWSERIFYRHYREGFQRNVDYRQSGTIYWKTEIAEDVQFPHGFHCIHIAPDVKIGGGCIVFQGVTIGLSVSRDNKYSGAPIIGNNVLIGAGAQIIGNSIIGDGARIGAGVVLTNVTIPPGAVIVNKSAYDLTNKRFIYPQD